MIYLPSNDKIRRGFKLQDEHYINKHDDAASNPKVQIFSDEDPEEEAERKYFCTMCKTRLDYLQEVEQWSCSGCGVMYDTKYLGDTPLKDTKDFKLMPHTALQRYPQFDENDPSLPFVSNVPVDELAGEAPEVELVKSSSDQRVKFIRVKGSLAEALSTTSETQ